MVRDSQVEVKIIRDFGDKTEMVDGIRSGLLRDILFGPRQLSIYMGLILKYVIQQSYIKLLLNQSNNFLLFYSLKVISMYQFSYDKLRALYILYIYPTLLYPQLYNSHSMSPNIYLALVYISVSCCAGLYY